MRTKRNIIVAVAATGLVLGAVPVASAQLGAGQAAAQEVETVQALQGPGFGRGFRGPRGGPDGALRAPIGRGLPLGTTVQVSFYDGDPAEGVDATATLSFTVGEDSEVAFADELAAAREGAAFMVVETSEQTRTIDLPDADDTDAIPLRRGGAFGLPLRGLETGDTVTAVFYDGDPEAGGSELQTLSFTYGEDSEAGFRSEVETAAGEADYVVVTTPPQERTVDLSAVPTGRDGRAGFGGPGGRR